MSSENPTPQSPSAPRFRGAAFAFYLITTLCLAVGTAAVFYARSFPVYTDPSAPGRLTDELYEKPSTERTREWYRRLSPYETPHKRFSDLGRGLLATGAGLLIATRIWKRLHRLPSLSTSALLGIWSALWLMRIPFSFWYYTLRLIRHDYPSWADSIAIGIFGECFSFLLYGAVTAVILRRLLVRHPLPAQFRLFRPVAWRGWLRAGFLGSWIMILVALVLIDIPDGNEGEVIACLNAGVILIAFLTAPEVRPKVETVLLNDPVEEAPA